MAMPSAAAVAQTCVRMHDSEDKVAACTRPRQLELAIVLRMQGRPLRLANDSDCGGKEATEIPLLGQEDRPLALALSLLPAASRNILKNFIPSLVMPPAHACPIATTNLVVAMGNRPIGPVGLLISIAYRWAYR